MSVDDRKINDAILALEAEGATVLRTDSALVVVLAKPAVGERLSVAEAAAHAKISERRIRELARAGAFPATEVGERGISILRVDLDEFLARHPLRVRAAADEDDDTDRAARLARHLAAEAGE